MTTAISFPIISAAGRTGSGVMVRGVEKSSAGRNFHDESATADTQRGSRSAAREGRPSCRNGTATAVSFWNGPRLRPAFVAQVIGQTMQARVPAPSAQAAYNRTAKRLATALDESV
jgi:hypothetical protein